MLSRKCIKSPNEKASVENVGQVWFTSPFSYHCWSNLPNVRGLCKTWTYPKPRFSFFQVQTKGVGGKRWPSLRMVVPVPFLTIANLIFQMLKCLIFVKTYIFDLCMCCVVSRWLTPHWSGSTNQFELVKDSCCVQIFWRTFSRFVNGSDDAIDRHWRWHWSFVSLLTPMRTMRWWPLC